MTTLFPGCCTLSLFLNELEYLRGELESILGENYFDLSEVSDLSSTDGEYDSDNFKNDDQMPANVECDVKMKTIPLK